MPPADALTGVLRWHKFFGGRFRYYGQVANAIASLAMLLMLLATPFWETKPQAQWDDRELEQMLTDSPWAQAAQTSGKSDAGTPVIVLFASASPIEEAERERARRDRLRPRAKSAKASAAGELDPFTEEYRLWLEDNRGTQIVVALQVSNTAAFSDEREVRRMEEESVMQIGRKKIKMSGHFPPTPNDPYLRLAFPRQVQLTDKSIVLDLYLPGVSIPYRQAQFTVKDMVVHGKLDL